MSTYYHSTLADNVKSILEKGLDPSFAGTGADRGVPTNIPGYRKLVFLTRKPMAQKYGPSVFEVNLPDEFPVEPLHSWPLQWLTGNYVTEKAIPPEYLKLMDKAASFGARMGKAAGAPLELAGPPYMPRYTPETLPRPKPEDGKAYTWRENDIYKTRQELYRKGQAARAAAGATGPGTTKAIMKDGVIQPGATFTPQGSMAPKDIDWSNIKLPQEQPLPAKSPVIESKTPKKLF